MYGIKVNYYMADPEEKLDYIKVPQWLGCIYPPVNIFVFDKEFCDHSYRWKNKEDALAFLNNHETLHNSCCFENARVEEVKGGDE